MNDNHCHGLFGWLFSHKFEPRFDTKYAKSDPNRASSLAETLKLYMTHHAVLYPCDIEALSEGFCDSDIQIESETYVHDVCVRCGKVISKQS